MISENKIAFDRILDPIAQFVLQGCSVFDMETSLPGSSSRYRTDFISRRRVTNLAIVSKGG
jgi:hypothetical protein